MGWLQGDLPANCDRHACADGEFYLYRTASLQGDVEIGRYTYIGEHSVVQARSKVTIGGFCSIAANFRCITHERPVTGLAAAFTLADILGLEFRGGSKVAALDQPTRSAHRPVTIGNDIWIGDNVFVAGGAKIGDGCVIGAKAVVDGECEPYGVYAGNPARLIRMRFSDAVVAELLALRWWEWPLDRMMENAAFFSTDLASHRGSIRDLLAPEHLPAWAGSTEDCRRE